MPDTVTDIIHKKVKLDGLTVHYVVLHPKQPEVVVMVHGFRGDHRGLLGIAQALPEYQVIIPDLPGCGQTEPMPKERHDFEGYAKLMRRFIDAMGFQRVVLMGHSYGALVASKLVADSTRGVSRLVLVNPIGESNRQLAVLGKVYYRIGLSLPEPLGRRVLYSRTVNRVQSFLMMKTMSPRLRRRIYRHHLSDLETPYRREVLAEGVSSVLERPVLDYAGKIRLPTLIIAGARDDLAPPAAQRRLQRAIQGSLLDTIPGVGHLTHLEQPLAVAGSIRAFLQAPARARRSDAQPAGRKSAQSGPA
jgi:pimeloyl-ACP methyl ester carboxylesterase